MTETTVAGDRVSARYYETDAERVLEFSHDETETTAEVAQNREGYAMLLVRAGDDERARERYYGFDMALDHAAELLRVSPAELPVPDAATDMGM